MSQLRDTKNKRTITKFLLLICLSLFGLKLQAQQAYVLADEKQGDYLLNNTSVLLDINGNQHPDSLIWGSAAKSFIPFSEYKWAKANPKSVLWLKIAVNNVSDHDILAFINWGYSSKIDAHIANVSKVTQTYHLGYSRERQQNIYSTPLYEGNLVLFRANPSETTLLVGYQCVDNMEIGIKLQNRELISEHEQKSNLLLGAFFGILLIMSIYHFLIYLNIKDRSYILYILYIAAVSITFLRTHSFLTNLFTGDIRLNFFTFTIFTDNLMTPAYFLFTRKYIKLKNISPKWDKTLLWMIRIRLMLIFALLVFFRTTHNINVTLLFINISLLIEIIIFAFSFQTIYKRGDLVAKYFIVGTMLLFSISVIAVFFLVLKPNTSWGTISIECGVILQILVFAAGFGKKLKLDEAEKLGVQGQLIEQLKQNELLQTKVNRELEGKVKERTHEIILQKEEIQAQMEELELSNKIIKKKNTQITDSIHYAKRIQEAFLPLESELANSFADYFVYYQAREIVSGDFYWIKKTDNRLLLAVADSTGHGVPGALMSMLGNAALNEVAGRSSDLSTAEILNQMREVVKQALRQTGESQEAKDGFDVVLCSFDFKNLTLEFSGANRPIIIYRDSKMVEYKGDRQPIGIYINETPFTAQTIKMEKGDAIYLFTDGYSSQFGGEKGETFKTKRFKELTQSIHKLPMAEQKQTIDNCLQEWKGPLDQIDDITILGLKV